MRACSFLCFGIIVVILAGTSDGFWFFCPVCRWEPWTRWIGCYKCEQDRWGRRSREPARYCSSKCDQRDSIEYRYCVHPCKNRGKSVLGRCSCPPGFSGPCCENSRCSSAGGSCQQPQQICQGTYVKGPCGDSDNMQCCMPGKDPKCTAHGGSCQLTNQACDGTYDRGLCDGPVNRKCCLPGLGTNQQICEGNVGNTIRGQDPAGAGWWHASRTSGLHKGIDIECAHGSKVYAPISGRLIRNFPYPKGKECINNGVQIGDRSEISVSLWYVDPDQSKINTIVSYGDVVGTHIGLHCVYPEHMTDHVHVTLWRKGTKVDPTEELGGADPR